MTPTDFAQIRAFLAVAETLNFSRAAEKLGVTPSALSQTIRAFEAEVGQQMFQRTTRSVVLTEAGAHLRGRMEPAVAEMSAALAQAHSKGGPRGTVRIVTFRSAAERFLLPVLPDLRRDLPEVTLDITLDDAVRDPVADGFDIAIRIGEVIAQDMIAVPLGADLRQIAVASPAYLSQHGAPGHPRDLLAHDCICWRWPGQLHPFPWEFFEDGRWFSITPSGGLVVNDKTVAQRAALDGLGIAFAIEDTVRDHIAAGALTPLLERWSAPFAGFHLTYPRQRHMPAATRAVIDKIRSDVRKDAR
ncbi:LysR family transcriptional regulator [Afifella sp. YEN Y35]|uniref:LysR family transcriptional regulator n=1 Tax=Afifella sp. YEN Y35 TaxID=3388337 RepID=UPI0039E11525